ncbi:hypothetical protein [Tropicimonas aquimaris]|uniref:Response regulatory domain-containing protein n=1 Tax=Tropicimonas aquimaris TaxID=914152 RepID=A0ABW3ITU1_9RHOB
MDDIRQGLEAASRSILALRDRPLAQGARRDLEMLRGRAADLARAIGEVLDETRTPEPAGWPAETPYCALPATTSGDADISGSRILLCRSEGFGQGALCQMLRHLGVVVTLATDAADALKRLASQHFDAMILQLPDWPEAVDALLGEIRRMDGPQAAVPVVAVATGRVVPDPEMLRILGIGAVLETPIMDVGVLSRTLARVLGRENGTASDASCAQRLEHLLHVSGDGPRTEILVQLESDFAVTHGTLHEAVEAGASDEIRKAAHVLVALAGTAGALALEDAARDIGRLARDAGAMPEVRALAGRILQDIDALRERIRKCVERHGQAGSGGCQ